MFHEQHNGCNFMAQQTTSSHSLSMSCSNFRHSSKLSNPTKGCRGRGPHRTRVHDTNSTGALLSHKHPHALLYSAVASKPNYTGLFYLFNPPQLRELPSAHIHPCISHPSTHKRHIRGVAHTTYHSFTHYAYRTNQFLRLTTQSSGGRWRRGPRGGRAPRAGGAATEVV